MNPAKRTIVTAGMHLAGFSWGLAFWFAYAYILPIRDAQWDLPPGPAFFLYLGAHPGIILVLFLSGLAVDILVLVTLSRRGMPRIQEVWTGLVAVAAMLGISMVAVTILAPYRAFYSAGIEYKATWQPVVQREEQQLHGTWELVAREQAGSKVRADQHTPSHLEFDAETQLANWTLGTGILGEQEITPYSWHIDIAPPKRLGFFAFRLYTPEAGYYRKLLYRFEDDQLVLCIAPREMPAQQLPTTFRTQDNENIVLYYRRVGFNGRVSE